MTLDKSTLSKWIKSGTAAKRPRGVAPLHDFEEAVERRIIVKSLPTSGDDDVTTLANAAYSYLAIKVAATEAKNEFQDDERVMQLQLSNRWVFNFLRRRGLRKRRITTALKKRPDEAEVQRVMTNIVSDFDKEGVSQLNRISMDETGMQSSPLLVHQFVAHGERAVQPGGYSSKHVTAMLGVVANGDCLPLLLIIKCSCQDKSNLTTSTVLKTFMAKEAPFNNGEWEPPWP